MRAVSILIGVLHDLSNCVALCLGWYWQRETRKVGKDRYPHGYKQVTSEGFGRIRKLW